jgi:hypothetical protein
MEMKWQFMDLKTLTPYGICYAYWNHSGETLMVGEVEGTIGGNKDSSWNLGSGSWTISLLTSWVKINEKKYVWYN